MTIPLPRLAEPAGKILIVLHQAQSTPGRVGQMLCQRGYRLDMRRPALGERLPETLADHAGCVIFGGPMSSNDTDAFVKQEIDFIDVVLRESVPFLGICLGAQMLCRAIGGQVGFHQDSLVEIGYYDLNPTPAGEVMMEWPRKVYQWHREGMTVPGSGATLLATGEHFEHQAFRVGDNAYGIQFHPELTLAMMHRWTTRASARMQLPGARQRRDHFAGRPVFDPAVRTWLSSFLDQWLAEERAPMPQAVSAASG
ncbi:glutamine amidotransferase [Amorphus sp. MBR-141]